MLSPHRLATLMVIRSAPDQIDLVQDEVDGLLERQLICAGRNRLSCATSVLDPRWRFDASCDSREVLSIFRWFERVSVISGPSGPCVRLPGRSSAQAGEMPIASEPQLAALVERHPAAGQWGDPGFPSQCRRSPCAPAVAFPNVRAVYTQLIEYEPHARRA